MLDFNRGRTFEEKVNLFIDNGIVEIESKRPERSYLGGSRLGVPCSKALQYEYLKTPKDEGREFDAKLLRIFAAGHVFEDLAITWLRQAGFEIYTEKPDGEQFGFSALNGKLRGHADGIINNAPAALKMTFPALWECKSLNNKSWNDTKKKGLTLSKPVYAAQIATYQAYLSETIPDLYKNPALFTAINKDTSEMYHELIPFDGRLAQDLSDKGLNVIVACDAGEILPRISKTPTHAECKKCPWQDRCWRAEA